MFILTLFLAVSGCSTVSAQKKMTGRELDGLKGLVKSLITEVEPLNPNGVSLNQPRQKNDEYYFDKEGKITEIAFPELNRKMIFSVIEGFKTYKNTKINEEPESNTRVIVIDQSKKPDNTVSSDKRYNGKFTYEHDAQGRVKIEEHYFSDGKLFQKTEYKYDDKGRIKEKIADNTSDLTTFTYKYDEKGNLIEQSKDRNVKKYGVDRNTKTIYSEYKIDSQGNWTQRTETSYIKEKRESVIAKSIYYRTITYYEK